jgi:hypothetical protein
LITAGGCYKAEDNQGLFSEEIEMTQKVFGIGLNKTGTTTLGTCLERLGYDHVSCRADLLADWRAGRKDTVFAVTDAHQSFEDWPWPLMYRDLSARYGTDAKFILTLRRSPEVWLRSLKMHALQRTSVRGHCRKLAYGYSYPHHAEAEHLEIYRRHQADVMEFFETAGASAQLRVLCWETGDGWDALCDFLGHDRVDWPFPHDRRAAIPRLNRRRIANQMAMMAGWAGGRTRSLFRAG